MFMHESSGPQPQAQSPQGNPNVAAFLQALAARAAQQAAAPSYQRPRQDQTTDIRLRPENRAFGQGSSWWHNGDFYESQATATPKFYYEGNPYGMVFDSTVNKNGQPVPYLHYYDSKDWNPKQFPFWNDFVGIMAHPFDSPDKGTTR